MAVAQFASGRQRIPLDASYLSVSSGGQTTAATNLYYCLQLENQAGINLLSVPVGPIAVGVGQRLTIALPSTIRKSGEGQENPSAAEMIDVADRYKTRAEFYKQRLVKYLQEKSGSNMFPLYNNPGQGVDTIIPDNEAYTTTIWLGDDDCCRCKSFEEKYHIYGVIWDG